MTLDWVKWTERTSSPHIWKTPEGFEQVYEARSSESIRRLQFCPSKFEPFWQEHLCSIMVHNLGLLSAGSGPEAGD